MSLELCSRVSRCFYLATLLAMALTTSRLDAHALLAESTPSAGSTMQGPMLEIRLRFNARIDGKRCQLELVGTSEKSLPLNLDPQPAPEIVSAHIGVPRGDYRLRWQVLAVDGHITRGEIPFNVK